MFTKKDMVAVLLLLTCQPVVCVSLQCGSTCRGGCDDFTRSCYNCTSDTYHRLCNSECSETCQSSCDRHSGNCDSCKPGHYGSWCIETCSSGCSTNCDMEKGNCGVCKTGYYGVWCNVECPSGCKSACNKITGNCLGCKNGFYGRHCNLGCVEKDCQGGCDQFYGTCSKCPLGFYGRSCDQSCYTNCKGSLCDSYSGNCFDCKQGHFGLHCNQSCPLNCNGNCHFQTGLCFSCSSGYYGKICELQCPKHCLGPCKQNGTCFSCVNGYFGDQCNYTCSGHCLGPCDQLSGTCFTCEDGHWGNQCNKTCGNNCVGSCHQDIGRCSHCRPGWYGLRCTKQCPTTCLNNTCSPVGTCLLCVDGYFGDRCQTECVECENNICTQDGVCMSGCRNGGGCSDTVSSTGESTRPNKPDTFTNGTVTSGTFSQSVTSLTPWTTAFTKTTSTTTTKITPFPEDDDNNMLIIAIVAVLVILAAILFGVSYYFLRRRAASKYETRRRMSNESSHVYSEADIQEERDNGYSYIEDVTDQTDRKYPFQPQTFRQINGTIGSFSPNDENKRQGRSGSFERQENDVASDGTNNYISVASPTNVIVKAENSVSNADEDPIECPYNQRTVRFLDNHTCTFSNASNMSGGCQLNSPATNLETAKNLSSETEDKNHNVFEHSQGSKTTDRSNIRSENDDCRLSNASFASSGYHVVFPAANLETARNLSSGTEDDNHNVSEHLQVSTTTNKSNISSENDDCRLSSGSFASSGYHVVFPAANVATDRNLSSGTEHSQVSKTTNKSNSGSENDDCRLSNASFASSGYHVVYPHANLETARNFSSETENDTHNVFKHSQVSKTTNEGYINSRNDDCRLSNASFASSGYHVVYPAANLETAKNFSSGTEDYTHNVFDISQVSQTTNKGHINLGYDDRRLSNASFASSGCHVVFPAANLETARNLSDCIENEIDNDFKNMHNQKY